MNNKIKRLESEIHNIDNKIIKTEERLGRAIKSSGLADEESRGFTGIRLSYGVARENVKIFSNYLVELKSEKESLVENYFVLATEKERDILSNTEGEFYSTREEELFLEQKSDDLDSLIFAYQCMIGSTNVRISLGIKDAGGITKEVEKDQKYLKYLENKLQTIVNRKEIVKSRLNELNHAQEK